MARPKRQVEPEDSFEEQPLTEQVSAPVTYAPPVYTPPPMQLHVERQGSQSEAYTRRFPQIRGGICEFCGVLDPNVESKFQYRLCPHYRGMQARCTYCPDQKDPDDVVYHETLNVAEHPDKPGTLVMWCGSFNCSQAHIKRFRRAGN